MYLDAQSIHSLDIHDEFSLCPVTPPGPFALLLHMRLCCRVTSARHNNPRAAKLVRPFPSTSIALLELVLQPSAARPSIFWNHLSLSCNRLHFHCPAPLSPSPNAIEDITTLWWYYPPASNWKGPSRLDDYHASGALLFWLFVYLARARVAGIRT